MSNNDILTRDPTDISSERTDALTRACVCRLAQGRGALRSGTCMYSLHNRIPSRRRQVTDLQHSLKTPRLDPPAFPRTSRSRRTELHSRSTSTIYRAPSALHFLFMCFIYADTSFSVVKVEPTCVHLTLLCGEDTCVLWRLAAWSIPF